MKISIENEKDNPYMGRKELQVLIEHTKGATPTKAMLQIELSKQVKKDPEHVDIVNIFSDVGKATSASKVYVWHDKKVKDLSKKEEKKEAEQTQEAKPAEARPAAVPAKKEEKKEAKPAEAKKEEKK